MPEVEFYFDYSCPWTYLAFTRLKETAARTGSSITWHPILLDDLLGKINPTLQRDRRDPDPRRTKYKVKDLADWAAFCGLTIRLPADWPVRAAPAAAGAIIADREGRMPGYSDAIFRAYFEDGLNIGLGEVVMDIAASAGLERSAFEKQVKASDVLRQVRGNSDTLIDRGGFGSPTMFVGGKMFFGNDRMPLVEFVLGQTSGRTFVMPGQHGA